MSNTLNDFFSVKINFSKKIKKKQFSQHSVLKELRRSDFLIEGNTLVDPKKIKKYKKGK